MLSHTAGARPAVPFYHAGIRFLVLALSRTGSPPIKRRTFKHIAWLQVETGPENDRRAGTPTPLFSLKIFITRHVIGRRNIPQYDVRVVDVAPLTDILGQLGAIHFVRAVVLRGVWQDVEIRAR